MYVLFSVSIFSRVMSRSLLWSWVLEMKPQWVNFDTWIKYWIFCVIQTYFLKFFFHTCQPFSERNVRTFNWTTAKDAKRPIDLTDVSCTCTCPVPWCVWNPNLFQAHTIQPLLRLKIINHCFLQSTSKGVTEDDTDDIESWVLLSV